MQGYHSLQLIYKSDRVTVSRAIRESDGKHIVLKSLATAYPSPRDLTRIRYEYDLSQKFSLSSMVPILSLEKEGNGYALVMEDVDGIPLLEYWSASPKTLSVFLQLSIQITESLAEIHKNEIIHKDIKPANILVQKNTGKVYLIDLGLASLLRSEEQAPIHPEALEGTLSYISPEQTGRMNRSIDFRSDLYSLGITFYELLTGRVPFDYMEPVEIVHAHIALPPIPPSEIDQTIPPAISNLILKLLSKNAEDRYFSANGLLEDLLLARELQLHKKPLDFVPGERESKGKFSIPQKLYGREAEVIFLLSAFDRIASSRNTIPEEDELEMFGGVKLVLVGGYSGVGKTALINEVHKPILEKRGYFLSGKFDQFKQNIPYSSLVQAFTGLIRQILSEKEENLLIWKEKILNACSPNTIVLHGLFPDLVHILGSQAMEKYQELQEAEEIFRTTFINFVGVFASEDHPLTLFVDDLQWADLPTLKFLEQLTLSKDLHHLLIIGAFRNNEVDSLHPLTRMIQTLEKEETQILKIFLAPLMEFFIERMICDTLHKEVGSELPLLVYQKTNGNPFFVRQFLKTLYRDKCISFDPSKGWEYDLEKINGFQYTENVVELVAANIQNFSYVTQTILKVASCIGASFSLSILSDCLGKTPKETAHALQESLKEGVLLPKSTNYHSIETLAEDEQIQSAEGITYRFLHDRVQQAAYSLFTDSEKIESHVKIGKSLLNSTTPETRGEKLFEIVNHLNYGKLVLKSEEERENLLQLNWKAGTKAAESFAFAVATKYFQEGILLVGKNTPQEIVFQLQFENASSQYKSGLVMEVRDTIDSILDFCTTKYQKALVYNLKVECLTNLGEFENSIQTCIEALKLFGIEIKPEINNRDIFIYYKTVSKKMKNKSIEELVDIPEIQDKEIKIAMEILMNTTSAAFWKLPNHGTLFSLIMVEFSIDYGNSYISSYAYSIYGILLMNLGDYKNSYIFAKLALSLYSKYPHNSIAVKIPLVLGFSIYNWVFHSKKSIELMMNSFHKYSNIKDIVYSSSIITNSYNIAFILGTDYNKIIDHYKPYIKYLQANQSQYFYNIFTFINQFICILSDKPPVWINFQNQIISESEFEEIINKSDSKIGSYIYYSIKMELDFLFGNYKNSYLNFQIQKPLRNFGKSFLTSAQDIFISSLLLLKLGLKEPNISETDTTKELESNIKQYKIWSEHNPYNFLHKYKIILAEYARFKKEYWEASILYDEAISSAVENEYNLDAGLSCELAGSFYESVDRKKNAYKYFSEAVYYYNLCGALAKEKELIKRYPHLTKTIFDKKTTIHTTRTYTAMVGSSQLDIESITKVTTALAAELQYETLLEKLLDILLENAGAQRGILLLLHNGNLFLEAEGKKESPKFSPYKNLPIDKYPFLPINVLQYSLRTGKPVILDSAVQDTQFGENSYIQESKLRSLLCMPIVSKGKTIGLLYLENNLTSGAFTKDRIEILNIISSQAAISIENAKLYESLSLSNKELELTNERATKAYLDLEASQKQLVQSDKMITLGTMVAGVAHEINTPLSAIKANSENISEALKSLLQKINPSLTDFSINDLQNTLTVLELAKPPSTPLSSRESRALKKNILSHLEKKGQPNADLLAEHIIGMGLTQALEANEEIFSHPKIAYYISIAFDLSGIQKKSNVIQSSAQKVSKIVKSLKSFMHFDQSEEKKPADLTEGMETVLIILHNKLKYGIEVVKNYGDVPQVLCFADELSQIWTNLIHNSIQAMGEKGTLQIDIEKQSRISDTPDIDKRNPNYIGEYISISIRDSGPGIPIEIRSKIFQAFFTTKSAGEGSGLGLHIIGKILEKHKGALYLESEPGRTKFSVFIPIADN